MTDDPKVILQPDVFMEMCKKPETKSIAMNAAHAARIAYGIQTIMDFLNKSEALCRQLTPAEQQYMWELNWYANHSAPHRVILDYVMSIPDEEPSTNGYDC